MSAAARKLCAAIGFIMVDASIQRAVSGAGVSIFRSHDPGLGRMSCVRATRGEIRYRYMRTQNGYGCTQYGYDALRAVINSSNRIIGYIILNYLTVQPLSTLLPLDKT